MPPIRTLVVKVGSSSLTTPRGRLSEARLARVVDQVVRVSDEEIVAALRLVFQRTKLAAEPSGAAGIAALAGHLGLRPGTRVVCVISGGNLDLGRLGAML